MSRGETGRARPRKPSHATEGLGDRIRCLRRQAGLSQTALGKRLGLSKRMIVYYEAQGGTPSPKLLTELARVLGVSVDQLLGAERVQAVEPPVRDVRIWRRLRAIEELSPQDRAAVFHLISALRRRTLRGRGKKLGDDVEDHAAGRPDGGR